MENQNSLLVEKITNNFVINQQITTSAIISFLLLGFNYQLSIAQEQGLPIIRNYTTKEYSNSPQIFTAIQDGRGIMYFGVNNGVMEYDGVTWNAVSVDNKSIVYSLAMDDKGKIYVGAIDEFGYLANDKKGNTVYISLMHLYTDTTLNPGIVYSIDITSKAVYFRTEIGIMQYLPDSETINIIKADAFGGFMASFIYKDVFYTQLLDRGLMLIDNQQLIPAINSEFFKNANQGV